MSDKLNINKKMNAAERALFYHQDGVFEIIAAAVLFNFGLDIVNKNQVISLFAYLPIVLYQSIKNQVFFSRITIFLAPFFAKL